MSLSRPFARLAASSLIAVLAVACSKKEAAPAGETRSASAGDVAAAPAPAPGSGGMASGLTDSVSTRADAGRIRGSATAPVWVIEVSDFQCPFCKQWHDQSFAALDKEYVQTGKVRLAYLNFPLSNIHPNARAAAEAAMCASVQGKFWELHESLFGAQARWESQPNPAPVFDSLANAAGVNMTSWRACTSTHAAAALIEADRDRSSRAGVSSTPTFFIGSEKVEGALPLDTFRVAIDRAIAKAGKQ